MTSISELTVGLNDAELGTLQLQETNLHVRTLKVACSLVHLIQGEYTPLAGCPLGVNANLSALLPFSCQFSEALQYGGLVGIFCIDMCIDTNAI